MCKTDSVRKANVRAFNLIEVLVAVFILVFMALMVAAVIPSSMRTVKASNYYTLANVIAQRKLDQLMDPAVGYSKLTPAKLQGDAPPGLVISKAGGTSSDPCEWFDPEPSVSGAFGREDYKVVGYFTKIDGLRRVNASPGCSSRSAEDTFPGGNDVMGKLEISGWQGKTTSDTGSPLMRATVTITWKAPGQGKSTYTTSTLIPRSGIL